MFVELKPILTDLFLLVRQICQVESLILYTYGLYSSFYKPQNYKVSARDLGAYVITINLVMRTQCRLTKILKYSLLFPGQFTLTMLGDPFISIKLEQTVEHSWILAFFVMQTTKRMSRADDT